MSTLIMKFGGSSIGTTVALTQVLSIVLHEHKRWDRLLLVVSALDGVTDMLLEAAQLAQINNQRGYRRIAATLRTRHLALVEQLPLGQTERQSLQADIDRLLFEMLDNCQHVANEPSTVLSPQTSDTIASVGEKLAARIVAALLRQNELRGVAIDGTDVIVTDMVYGNATPDLKLTCERIQQHLLPMLGRQIVPIVTGYIGSTLQGQTTTMGRGGSDYTASIMSVCTQANELWIWSDVDGMMTTDPREVPDAQAIPELSYNEVAEMAYFGARILHARMIQPLKAKNIPLRIKNVYKPQHAGTLIRQPERAATPHVKAITSVNGIILKANRSGNLSNIVNLVDETLFKSIGVRADVMIASQSSSSSFLCFVVPTSAGAEAVDSLVFSLKQKLDNLHDAVDWEVLPATVVTALGDGLATDLLLQAQLMSKMEGCEVLGVAQGPSGCSLSFITHPTYAEKAVRSLHTLALRSAGDND